MCQHTHHNRSLGVQVANDDHAEKKYVDDAEQEVCQQTHHNGLSGMQVANRTRHVLGHGNDLGAVQLQVGIKQKGLGAGVRVCSRQVFSKQACSKEVSRQV